MRLEQAMDNESDVPCIRYGHGDLSADVTVVTYGYMASLAADAALRCFVDSEIVVEVLCLEIISPLDMRPILQSVARTRALVVIEEGTKAWGVGSEVAACVCERIAGQLAIRRIGAKGIVPAAVTLEQACLPSIEDIVSTVDEVFDATQGR